MKKLTLIAITSLFSLNLFCQVHWTKHPDNPVMVPGASGEWNSLTLGPGTVMFYDNTYHMYFDGSDYHSQAIGYATSPDGITWTQDVNNNNFRQFLQEIEVRYIIYPRYYQEKKALVFQRIARVSFFKVR